MQPLQLMEQPAAPAAAKEASKAAKLPLLSLLTFSPMGNPLTELAPGQCALFFDYLARSLHDQKKEHADRVAALTKKVALPAPMAAAAMGTRALSGKGKAAAAAQNGEEAKKGMSHAIALEKVKWESASKGEGATGAAGAAGISFTAIISKKGEASKPGGEGAAGWHLPPSFGQKAGEVSAAIGRLSGVVDDYARGDWEKERQVVGEFHGRMRSANYKTDDLMASLLLVIEDNVWGGGGEGGLGTTHPHGGATRLAALVPQKLRSSAQESAEVRLASVREMLRYYFLRHPNDYYSVLAAALGMAADEEEDITFLQERLAYDLARIGSFALAQKLLAELKKKKAMDTKNCLLRLGYMYDKGNRRLIIGKRTCGKPREAKGIVGLLLASARKGPD